MSTTEPGPVVRNGVDLERFMVEPRCDPAVRRELGADEHDVLALAWAFAPLDRQPGIIA